MLKTRIYIKLKTEITNNLFRVLRFNFTDNECYAMIEFDDQFIWININKCEFENYDSKIKFYSLYRKTL